jgi:hypothetical protein
MCVYYCPTRPTRKSHLFGTFYIVISAACLSLSDISHFMSQTAQFFLGGGGKFTEPKTCVLLYPTTYV